MKGDVNYRVFTNQTGLYIEFPVIKGLAARNEKSAIASVPPPPAKAAQDILPVQGRRREFRPVSIRDVKVAAQEPGHVSFEFVLSAKTEYRVIPIENQPVRLAIDLQNAQSGQMLKTVNMKNVKTIRGGNNSAAVYRIVFDLDYLKHFSVQAKDNLLQVEFFDAPQWPRRLRP